MRTAFTPRKTVRDGRNVTHESVVVHEGSEVVGSPVGVGHLLRQNEEVTRLVVLHVRCVDVDVRPAVRPLDLVPDSYQNMCRGNEIVVLWC